MLIDRLTLLGRRRFMRTLSITALFLVAAGFARAGHQNLRVLNKDISDADLKKTMEGFAEQLGVKCTYCHVPDQYERDDRPQKAQARRMIRLVMDMRMKRADYFGPRAKEAAITCSLCHRGKPEPEPFVPGALSY